MKKFGLVLLFLATGCGGSLSREERKELAEAGKQQEIRRVTEAEIDEAVLSQGRAITGLAMILKDDPARIDSLGRAKNVTLRWVTPGASNALSLEQQIIDAYVMSAVDGDLPDNVQALGDDSVLYSRPAVSKLPDGAVQVDGMWSVVFSKKDIVLGME